MSQSLARLHTHLVFATKGREPRLQDTLRSDFHAHMATVLTNTGCQTLLINSVEDHVHLLFDLGRTVALADVVKTVKIASSSWLKTKDAALGNFAWQSGYGAFSVSQSNLVAVRRYIENQREHHARFSFQDEYRALLEKHGYAYDERFVWE